jgi:cysteinyl-tRNA synthetase
MYVCGPTVYDYAHIGNVRPTVVFDVLYRLLLRLYPSVTYVRNITDIDDKIIAASFSQGESVDTITERTIQAFHEDVAALGVLTPDIEPRATAYIQAMIAMIKRLVELGHAYLAEEHVLFYVPSMTDYGMLSGHNRDELIVGARVEIVPFKRNPADFVLWKPSDDSQPGWDSPWGRGRPGWHIECSAMSSVHLGSCFDIHGGGLDLIFPHHENEIAQSRCAHGTQFLARYWLHNGFLTVEGQKMSKSLGNFLTVRQLLTNHTGEVLRLTLLATHYRQPLDFTQEGLCQARTVLDRFYGALRGSTGPFPSSAVESTAVDAALKDDLNTPQALVELHELVKKLNKEKDQKKQEVLRLQLKAGGAMLGLLQVEPESWFKDSKHNASSAADEIYIADMLAKRQAARSERNFALADDIRINLAKCGILLEDGPLSTTWKRL